MPARRIVLIAFPRLQSLDLTGPLEVFAAAGRLRPGSYAVQVAAADAGPLRSTSGLAIHPERTLASLRGPLDTVLVAGGDGAEDAGGNDALVAWLRRAPSRSRRVGSVCTGAFLLARAGLLDGRRATTHWAYAASLAERHPAVKVDRDAIFVRDGSIYTSAGVTAGIDLSLALVEEDLGPRVALEVARWLVLFARRSGGQAQFSRLLREQTASPAPLRDLAAWLDDNLAADLSNEALASRVHMSPRHFARVFAREVGATPAVYVETVRVERARLMLETTSHPVERIAAECGFGTPETLRRAFNRRLRVSPALYRSRFRPQLEEAV